MWLYRQTVCPNCFSHKLWTEPDTDTCWEVWTHTLDSVHVQQWTTIPEVMKQHQKCLSMHGYCCNLILQWWESRGAQRGDKLNAPQECLAKLMVKQAFLFWCPLAIERLHTESRGAEKTAVCHASQTRTFLVEGRALLIQASCDHNLSIKDGSFILQGKHWWFLIHY